MTDEFDTDTDTTTATDYPLCCEDADCGHCEENHR